VKQSIREFVKKINRERKVTMILTTHDLRDIEELCSRIVMIDRGKIVFDGTLDALRARAADSAQMTFSMHAALEKEWQPGALPTQGITWKAQGTSLQALLDRHAPPRAEVIRAVLDRYGQQVEDISIAEPQIEHIVRQIYASSPGA
jgi:ABC-2 type transport system ATP-binding protein